MTGRPCKPDADTQRLWRMLMPGTPMPVCGTGEAETPAADSVTTAASESATNKTPAGDKRR